MKCFCPLDQIPSLAGLVKGVMFYQHHVPAGQDTPAIAFAPARQQPYEKNRFHCQKVVSSELKAFAKLA